MINVTSLNSSGQGSLWSGYLPISHLHQAALVNKREPGTTPDTTRSSLNGFGIFAVVVFACVSLIVIRPLRIKVPRPIANVLRRNGKEAWRFIAGVPDSNDETNPELPKPEPLYLVIDHIAAPVIGVIILLATTTIGGEQVKQGIVGEDGIEPYDVLALFISLAYIAISLDATGLLRYLAFMICLKAGRQGREAKGKTLFLLLYFFFWSAGVLVGNDPVILSGTAFLVYFTRVAGISPPDAWIWAEFVAANISSAVLVSSNPTNLVIASGFGVDFITYTAYMVLPAFGSAVGGLVAILLYFRNSDGGAAQQTEKGKKSSALHRLTNSVPRLGHAHWTKSQIRQRGGVSGAANKPTNGTSMTSEESPKVSDSKKPKTPIIYIPETIIRPDVDPHAALVDKKGAIFGSIVMAATLATLVGTSVIGGVKVFEIAVPGAVLCLARDAIADYLQWRSLKLNKSKPKDELEATNTGQTHATDTLSSSRAGVQEVEAIEMNTIKANRGDLEPVQSIDKTFSRESPPMPRLDDTKATPLSTAYTSKNWIRRAMRFRAKLADMFPTVSVVLSRLPFPLLPFAFSMFILVQALAHVGFINIMAKGLGKVCSSGFVLTAFFISFLGVVLCNIGGTNIGATILLTKAIRSPYFTKQIAELSNADQELITKVAQYSIAFGSNVGALGGTFAASLAGLLWLSGLKQGGITVRARQFLVWCMVVIVPSTVIGIAIIIAEVRYFHVGT